MLQIIIDKLNLSYERIQILTKKTIREKLLEYFKFEANKKHSKKFKMSLSFTSLAEYLAVDRSALMREVKYLKEDERVSLAQINNIIKYIESLNKKRILVEDIQDIIEIRLMATGKYELAKKYITYRYTRALIRKANTIDELILSLFKNNNLFIKCKGRDFYEYF